MGYKVPLKCITYFLAILYVNVNVNYYKTTRVWKEGGKLLTNVYARGDKLPIKYINAKKCEVL
jgi:hypothetical protein